MIAIAFFILLRVRISSTAKLGISFVRCGGFFLTFVRRMETFNEHTLANGLRIVQEEAPTGVVYCGYVVKAGTRHEDAADSGIAHFCEHLTFKGTERRRAYHIANALERVGGDLNAFTSKQETVYYATVLRDDFARAVDVLTDIVFHSTYPQREIDREVDVIADEIDSYNDSPAELIYDEFESMVFAGHPLGRDILGDAARLRQYTTADVETNSRTSFVFRRNADGTLTMQNAGSGFFLGPETGSGNTTYDYRPIQWYEPNNVQLIPLGDGQVGFRTESGRYIRGNAAWYADGMTYEYNEGNEPMAYSAFAWQVYPVSDICSQITETQSIAQGRVIAITKPHDLESLPTTEYGTVQGYRIVGKLTEEGSSDSIITAYKLQAYEDGEIIPAGTPVIYITEGDSYNADVSYEVEFNPYIDGEVTNLPDTVNGLAGNIDSYTTDIDHLGYFLEDSVVDEPVGVLIGYNRAYIIPWLVEEVPDATVDKIVYVKGAGMLNDIKDVVIEDQKEKVDVYSIDGVLIRRNVARAGATNGLAKGIYIVGKQKVLVK